jgi:DHA2 family multidrug resistance protein
MTATYPAPALRTLITLFTMMGVFMTQLDTTIANVALPHMQASTAASHEQITWVLTSYIIMAAMLTPLAGWLATRYGRRRIIILSVIGFTLASVLCGLAANFGQLIGFRILQGMLGAALLPISQAIMIDINPPERHGTAMALWGLGAVLGPIIGPVLGGYLTDYLNWRWVFFINLPVGIVSAIGLLIYLPESSEQAPVRLDLIGFGLLALAVGAFQLMLDRGQLLDWFQSAEIWTEATLAATALTLLIIHCATARNPFVRLAIIKDTNFLLGCFYGFVLGGVMYGVMALIAPMLAELMGYPVKLIGLVSMPRGIGTMAAMLLVGPLVDRFDARLVVFIGLVICAISLAMMAGFSLEADSWLIILTGFIQGVGGGIMFVPITTIVFATIEPRYRNEGAALNSLVRGLSGSVWISVLQSLTIRNAATVQSRLAEGVRPDNPAMAFAMPDFDFDRVESLSRMDSEIIRQALMVAYTDSFWLLFLTCLVAAPMVLLLKR